MPPGIQGVARFRIRLDCGDTKGEDLESLHTDGTMWNC